MDGAYAKRPAVLVAVPPLLADLVRHVTTGDTGLSIIAEISDLGDRRPAPARPGPRRRHPRSCRYCRDPERRARPIDAAVREGVGANGGLHPIVRSRRRRRQRVRAGDAGRLLRR